MDIDNNDQLTEKFGLTIPVLEIGDRIMHCGGVDQSVIKNFILASDISISSDVK